MVSSNLVHQQHWHLSTEPNFITKPRPPNWEKPITLRPKPSKPSKKPLNTTLIWLTMQQQQQHTTSPQPPLIFSNYSTRKPIKLPKPTSSTSASTTTKTTTKTSTSATSFSTSTLTTPTKTTTLKPKPTVCKRNKISKT